MAGMMDVFSIASSGLQASSAKLNVTAQNIVNADTPGYTERRADTVELSTGGVAVDSVQDAGQSVDLAHEMVHLSLEKQQYNANAMVVKTADRMIGSLLDVMSDDHHRDSSRY